MGIIQGPSFLKAGLYLYSAVHEKHTVTCIFLLRACVTCVPPLPADTDLRAWRTRRRQCTTGPPAPKRAARPSLHPRPAAPPPAPWHRGRAMPLHIRPRPPFQKLNLQPVNYPLAQPLSSEPGCKTGRSLPHSRWVIAVAKKGPGRRVTPAAAGTICDSPASCSPTTEMGALLSEAGKGIFLACNN